MELQPFSKLDEIKLDRNLDRIIPYSDNMYLLASYHLDKDTQTKTGEFVLVTVIDNKIQVLSKTPTYFDYGILSIKKETDQSFSLGCSDGTVKTLKISEDMICDPLLTYSQDSSVCLMHDTSQQYVASAHSNGTLNIFDKSTAQVISSHEKLHQFDIWYTKIFEDALIYTGADDFAFKCLDIRSQSQVYSNKRHEAGVTWIEKYEEHMLMTGSYDGSVRIWDERSMKQELEGRKFDGKTIWDVKFHNGKMGIAAIYDGYLFSKNAQSLASPGFTLEQYDFEQYTDHESICYAFEYLPESDLILTTSFYDSTLQLLKQML